MAHGESNPLIKLAQLRDLEELKIQTPVTQCVISHIDMLVKLDEQKRKTLETFVLLLKTKVYTYSLLYVYGNIK